MTASPTKLKPGVVWGESYQQLVAACKAGGYALPAVNVIGTNSVNAVLEAAARNKSDVIIQLSNGGAQFFELLLRLEGVFQRLRLQRQGRKHILVAACVNQHSFMFF